MMNRGMGPGSMGRYGDEYELGNQGVGQPIGSPVGAQLAQDPEDAYVDSLIESELGQLGSMDIDELQGHMCDACATEQIGYFSDDGEDELIGTYCPSCGKMGIGDMPDDPVDGFTEDETVYGFAQYPDEEAGYINGLGQEEDDYIPGMEAWGDDFQDPNVGTLAEEIDYEHVGEIGDDDVVGGYSLADDAVDGYQAETPPPFNPAVSLNGLEGYQPERAVNPVAALKRTVPATPVRDLPEFFKPHI